MLSCLFWVDWLRVDTLANQEEKASCGAPCSINSVSFLALYFCGYTNDTQDHFTLELLIYTVFVVIIPLIITRIFWKLFVTTRCELHFRKSITLAASVVVILAMLINHYGKTRFFEINSYYSSYVQLVGNDWSEDRPILEEAISTVVEGIPVKADLYSPHDPSLPEELIENQYGWVHVQWRSLTGLESFKTEVKLADHLRASIPRRFNVNSGHSDRGGLKWKQHVQYSLVYIFPIFAPFVIALLITNGKRSELIIVGVTALVTVGFVLKTNWPGALYPSIPLITNIDSIEDIPEPEFDYSTTWDATLSHIKAAEQGNIDVFESAFSPQLLDLVSKFEGDSSKLMDRWKSLTYNEPQTSDENNMSVGVKHKQTGKKFTVNLVKLDGNWKIDTFLPIPEEQTPKDAFQQMIDAAQKESILGIIPVLPNVHTHVTKKEISYLLTFSILSWGIDSEDSDKGWVDINRSKNEPDERYFMIKVRDQWKLSGVTSIDNTQLRKLKYSTPRDATLSHIDAAMKDHPAVFDQGFSIRLMDLVIKFNGDTTKLMDRWKSLIYDDEEIIDEKNVKVTVKHKHTGKQFTVDLTKSDGVWRIDTFLPMPYKANPDVFYQQMIDSAKKRDSLGVLNGVSDQFIATELDSLKTFKEPKKLESIMSQTIISWKVDPNDSSKAQVKVKGEKPDNKGEYRIIINMAKERDHWKINEGAQFPEKP